MKLFLYNKVERIPAELLLKAAEKLRLDHNWSELNFIWGIFRAQKKYPKLTVEQYRRGIITLQQQGLSKIKKE